MKREQQQWTKTLVCSIVVACGLGGDFHIPASDAQVNAPAPGGGKVYATSWFGGVLSVVDLATRQVMSTIAVGVQNHNVMLSPDQKSAWVTNNNDGTVSIIDTTTDRVVDTLRVGNGPRHTFFSADGAEAYVTNEFDDTVAVLDPNARRILATVAVGHMPHFPIVVGDKLFVTNFGSGTVTVIARPLAKS